MQYGGVAVGFEGVGRVGVGAFFGQWRRGVGGGEALNETCSQ